MFSFFKRFRGSKSAENAPADATTTPEAEAPEAQADAAPAAEPAVSSAVPSAVPPAVPPVAPVAAPEVRQPDAGQSQATAAAGPAAPPVAPEARTAAPEAQPPRAEPPQTTPAVVVPAASPVEPEARTIAPEAQPPRVEPPQPTPAVVAPAAPPVAPEARTVAPEAHPPRAEPPQPTPAVVAPAAPPVEPEARTAAPEAQPPRAEPPQPTPAVVVPAASPVAPEARNAAPEAQPPRAEPPQPTPAPVAPEARTAAPEPQPPRAEPPQPTPAAGQPAAVPPAPAPAQPVTRPAPQPSPAPSTPAPRPAAPAPVSQPGGSAAPETVEIIPPPAPEPAAKKSWLARLKSGLSKTSSNITSIFVNAKIDEDLYEELETALLMSDAGVDATQYLLDALRAKVRAERLTDAQQVKTALRSLLIDLLKPLEKSLMLGRAQPLVMMIAGVNGAGKTTSIGKLAKHLQRFDQSVLLAAGDTFRAAAREQLAIWGERNNVTVVSQESGDPAAVIFDAVGAARARNIDVLMADTAGRLPTQLHLMEELRKVKRVIGKALEGAPHEVLLVIDANTGQNALAQVKAFDDALGLTGLIVTKLDGTAKGGILAAIARQRPVPVYFIGVGEKVEDLQPFSAEEFSDALLGN